MLQMLQTVWRYRGFILGLVYRELQSRYTRSVLGSLWLILQPLVAILIYTVVFSQVMRARLPGIQDSWAYGIYLCAGILPWGYFSEIVTRSQTVFIERADLLKKVLFPRSLLPLSVLLSATVNVFLLFTLFLIFLVLVGKWPGIVIAGVPVLLVIQAAFALGLGVTLGTLNIFFRDIVHLWGILIQFWFWLTPIVYPVSIVPQWLRLYIAWNPMFPLISGYQAIFVQNTWPAWTSLTWVAIMSGAALFSGWLVFRGLSGEMVDEL